MSANKTQAARKAKARVMWAESAESLLRDHNMITLWCPGAVKGTHWKQPVAVIPLDDIDALVDLASQAITSSRVTGVWMGTQSAARAALAAIGIPCKQTEGPQMSTQPVPGSRFSSVPVRLHEGNWLYRNFNVVTRASKKGLRWQILSACGDAHPVKSPDAARKLIDSWYAEGSVES